MAQGNRIGTHKTQNSENGPNGKNLENKGSWKMKNPSMKYESKTKTPCRFHFKNIKG